MNLRRRSLVLLLLIAVLPVTALGQDARSVLAAAAKAMGAESLKELHYSGSGSSYVVSPGNAPAGGWPHAVMKSYMRSLNLDTTASTLQVVRTEGNPPMDRTLSHQIDASSLHRWTINWPKVSPR